MAKRTLKKWTEKEDTFIRENYLEMGDEEMAKKLRGRTRKSVQIRRWGLKLKRPADKNRGSKGVRKTAVAPKSKGVSNIQLAQAKKAGIKEGVSRAQKKILEIASGYWKSGNDELANDLRDVANNL